MQPRRKHTKFLKEQYYKQEQCTRKTHTTFKIVKNRPKNRFRIAKLIKRLNMKPKENKKKTSNTNKVEKCYKIT
jgi:hypothetical protein